MADEQDGQEVDLFGKVIDDYKTIKERFGIWPTTVWECDFSDPYVKRMKALIGDDGMAREGCNRKGNNGPSYQKTTSIFNPAVASWILNCYAPKDGVCLDPFAGGGTRAILAAKHGLKYYGVELREVEANAVVDRCRRAGVFDSICIMVGDSSAPIAMEDNSGDFCMTCPPYYDMERYEGGPADLSMCATYEQFVAGIDKVVANTARILKPGAVSCWVVGLHRDNDGGLLSMHHDLSVCHRRHGFRCKEEVILAQKNNGAIQRVGMFEKGQNLLVRLHEYLMVYVKK